MIRKQNFKLNWKYALGELVLIFMGISLAIGFQNWNDERKKLTLEKDLLSQIYADISNNRGDLESDFIWLGQGVKSHFKIIDAFKNDEPYSPEFAFHFYFLTIDEYTYPIQINYERLKNIGLEIISSDSLGVMIEELYEFAYPRIDIQKSFHPDITDHFSDFYASNFKPNEDLNLKFELPYPDGSDGNHIKFPEDPRVSWRNEPETAGFVPLNYELLKRDTQFQMLMKQAYEFRVYKYRQYQRIIELSESIMNAIEQTIDTSTLK
jgi:hypothetical protein